MKIIVKKGEGLIGGKWVEAEEDISITVTANNGIAVRRDSVFLRVDDSRSIRKASIQYRTGGASYPPIDESLRGKEYRIANVRVDPGATYINQNAITDLRGSSDCPWITSLIQQVDTSTLYDQWQAAYQNYYDSTTAEFNEWLNSLTEELNVYTSLAVYDSTYITTETETTTIPINIPSYNKEKDVLYVFINGLRIIPVTDYVISDDNMSITLIKSVTANQKISFLALQSVVVKDPETTLTKITELNAKITPLLSDSGWIDLTLESGAEEFDASSTPAVRRYSNNVYIRGAIKGLNTAPATICTIPTDMCPSMNHQYTTTALLDDSLITCMLEIKTTGQVTLIAKSGSIPADAMLSISTNFIVG